MEMTGEHRIPAPRQQVWEALNDAQVLAACIPNCQAVEKLSETEFKATVSLKVGPVRAKFGGKITLSELDPPASFSINGEGQGGPAGFAKGGAQVTLDAEEDNSTTVLRYRAQANVGGKLAQIGSRLVDTAAKQIAGQFFEAFVAHMTAAAETAALAAAEQPAASPPPPAAEPAGLPPVVWVASLIAIVFVGLIYYGLKQ
ncbi:MAG TPA: carbon monoxide dehydrogenase subunit G [Alphaproteobacteria bacterium]|jgi:hypothetical protein|nr:carbon monoxide dehydrogenase subunit G [Alphaproteobacteria bacterium]MDP6269604.1 carbon monoxide dehydrogenase subunit G [Alphaproteobacteria bacterium]MDP7428413.1 carbon monoxide dehydrogenase subunit G [Alphaproteobacteria bacterium]HJM48927.1 carbon monoxide dehydrogenase subunit G [Alphaproteobacteria bacterium]